MELVKRLQDAVTPDLITKQYRDPSKHKLWGACYIVSEALYHLWGKEHGWSPARMLNPEGSGTHWFLVKNGVVIDPTIEQFSTTPTYASYTKTGFLTKQPSKRAQILIDRVS